MSGRVGGLAVGSWGLSGGSGEESPRNNFVGGASTKNTILF